jgi:hypothetical protein
MSSKPWSGAPSATPSRTTTSDAKIVCWHRELPPLDAVAMDQHTVEADSRRIAGTLALRNELWGQCYEDLMTATEGRLIQEIARLGGDYAHVHDEAIVPKHDAAAGSVWLHGRFGYTLYRRPQATG